MAAAHPPRSRLPDERIPPSRWKRLAVLLALLVGGIWGINAASTRYLAHYGTNLGYRMVAAKYDLLEQLDGTDPVDWLILGDSSAAHGIVPAAWSEVTGGTSQNLAVVADLLVANDAWMLAEYLERVGTPKHVVLVHAHDIWRRGYNSALLGQIPRPWGIWNRRKPHIELLDGHTLKIAYSYFLPLLSQSSTLRAHLKNLGPTRTLDLQMTPNGWIPGRPHTPYRVAKDLNHTTQRLQKRPFWMSPHNKQALKMLRWMSEKHQFQLHVAHGPMLDTVAKSEEFQTYIAKADKRIYGVVGTSEQVTVVPDVLQFPTLSMEATVDHLIPSVAPEYTRMLATIVSGSPKERAPRTKADPAGE